MIITGRLTLEPLVRGHAPEMFAALSAPAIYRYIEEKPPVSLEALADRYERLESRKSADGRQLWLNWVVRESASGKVAGYVQATVLEDRAALVAYLILALGFTLVPGGKGDDLVFERRLASGAPG